MDLTKMIADLRKERSAIDQAILCWNEWERGKVVDMEDHGLG